MRSAGDTGLDGDPSRIPAHDLDCHDAVMGLGGGVNLINRISGGLQGGVETESYVGGTEVIVNGLGNADQVHAFAEKIQANLLRAVPADGDDRIDAQGAGIGDDLVGDVADNFFAVLDGLVVKRIASVGGAQNGAAAGQDSADIGERELARTFRPDETIEAIGNADDFPFVFEDGGFHGRANDRIQAGSVAAPGADADAADISHGRWSTSRPEHPGW